MIVLSGALVLVALVLLVFGALDRNLPYVYGSIGVSVLSLLLLLVGILQRRGELAGEEQDEAPTTVTETTDERLPALASAGAQAAAAQGEAAPATAALPVVDPQPASRRVVPDTAPVEAPVAEPVEAFEDDQELEDDEDLEDEDFEDDEAVGSGVTVLVVSGRPRYHLEGCRVLRGKEPQPLDRDDARMHGFTPCGVCKPDADETALEPQPDSAPQAAGGESFTETLFGGPLFADGPPAGDPERDDDRVETSALPARPVQPVLARVDGPADPEPSEAPADLRGDDPADDPSLEVDETPVTPVPDLAADPDELPELEDLPAAEASVDDAPVETVDAPVLEPVAEDAAPEADVEPAAAEVATAPVRARRTATARKAAPVEEAQTLDLPEEAPVPRAAEKKAPAKKAPAKKAPAKKAPAKRATKAGAAPPVEPPAAPKRPLVRAVRADALRLGAPSAGSTTTRVAVRAAAPAGAPPVVVVPDRDRFHRPKCRYVRGVAGATTLPKASATRQGYAACGVCKP